MAFPVNAKQKKLTRQFPGENIWDLLQRERIKDVSDWLREEIALRDWGLEDAESSLKTDKGHINRIIHRQRKASKDKVITFAITFGYACDEEGVMTTDRIDFLLVLFGYTPMNRVW